MSLSVRHALFRSSGFLWAQPDEDVDAWCIGADCAGWIYAHLLPVPGIEPARELIMEDWGWWMSVAVDAVRVPLTLQAYFTLEDVWNITVEPPSARWGLLRKHSRSVTSGAQDRVWAAVGEILSDASTVDALLLPEQDPWMHEVTSLD